MFEFEAFPKIPRLKKGITVTEKIDGTNAQIALFEITNEDDLARCKQDNFCLDIFQGEENGGNPIALYAGSRNRWLEPGKSDNFGFSAWVKGYRDSLRALGLGRHFGEWFGLGIQRDYGLTYRRFALFNTHRWNEENPPPACCSVVPVLATGEDVNTDRIMEELRATGSKVVPGYGNPEGIVVYHSGSRQMYKRTFEQDKGKWVP